MSPPRFHQLRIADLRRETADCVSIAFAVPTALREAYAFVPGQYLTLSAIIDGEEVRRSYSICSGLDDGELRVAVKRIPGGAFSCWASEALRAGDALSVMTPDGRFGVPIEPGAAHLLVGFAAGSGITPVLAILSSVLHREPYSRFVLFYGNRDRDSIIFRDRLGDLKDRFLSRLAVFHVLSREQQDLPALNGRLDAPTASTLLRAMVPLAAVDHVFVCGPQPMIEALPGALTTLDLPLARIHVERFTPGEGGRPRPVPVPVRRAAAPAAMATVICDGRRAEIPVAAGEAIIDAAIRAGRSLPWSCKGGMCCTCRAKLLAGRVAMAVNYSLEPWETAAGYVLTCQAHPLTAQVVLDYDQV